MTSTWTKVDLFTNYQDKPLLKAFDAKKENFPGGKEFLTVVLIGEYTTEIEVSV